MVILTVVLIGAAAGAAAWYIHGGKARGADLLIRNRCAEARAEFERYLWLFGDDDEVQFRLAEAWARDNALLGRPAAERSIALLDAIPQDSEFAARSRTQSGRLRLLILGQPCRAERDFRTATRLDPDLFDAHYMLWKTLDLTRRYHLVEPSFNACLEHCPPERLQAILYDWYFSQFSTFAAAAELDEGMGFLKSGQTPDALTEYRRIRSFEHNETDCALTAAVLADWCDEYHVAEEKDKWLRTAWERVGGSTAPWVFAVLFDLLLDDGRFDDARTVFEAWPEPRDSYDYYTRRGIFLSEVENDPDAAADACRNAIAIWPGPVDWQVHHRLAGLLTRLGRNNEADRIRERAHYLEQRMEVDFHRRLRRLLLNGDPDDRNRRMAEFYDEIDRPAEAAAWRSLSSRGSAARR